MKKNKPFKVSFGMVLIIFAALANLARWVGMFTLNDEAPEWVTNIIPGLGAFSGLVSGLSIAGGLAFLAHRLGALQPFTPKGRLIMRFWGSLVLGILVIVMSAFLLPPYVRMMTPERLRVEISDLSLWSVMSVLVGDLVIVAVALSDGKAAGFTQSIAPAQKSAKSAKPSAKTSAKSAETISQYPRKCQHCDMQIDSSHAVGAHMKKHHPELCKSKLPSKAEALFKAPVAKE